MGKREIERLFDLSHDTPRDRIEAAYSTLNLRLELLIRPAAYFSLDASGRSRKKVGDGAL
ncbi:MAG: hypothetical protein SFV18_05420 [Bryobacteraceae bacterium]|nr:hypothetical protein [Bryobacteraceae bacterium]